MTIISRTEDLEILLTVVDCGSLSAASRVLEIQVAKVSRAISRLEQQLDCTLMNRTTRKLELTEEGKSFTEMVRKGLNTIVEAEDLVRAFKGIPSGKLRVDAVTPFILHQLVPLVPGFRDQYPQIELELVANENIIDLIERRTDLAIRIGALQDSNLHARFLGRSPLHIVASPDYLAKYSTPTNIYDLSKHQIIGFVDAPHLNRWPLSTAVNLPMTMGSSSGETIRQLCIAGQGFALLSEFMICKDLQEGRLVSVLNEEIRKESDRELVHAVYYRNTSLSTRISAFIDYISNRLCLS